MENQIEVKLLQDWQGESAWAVEEFRNLPRGALPPGTLVEKCNTETSDSLHDGDRGEIKGSAILEGRTFYCVEWEKYPGVPVWINERRLKVRE